MSVTVPSVSVTWMKNRNKCDTTVMCFSALQGQTCFRPSDKLLRKNTEKMAAPQKILKTTLMRRATETK